MTELENEYYEVIVETNQTLEDLRSYLSSSKFRNDTKVQVSDVLRYLDNVDIDLESLDPEAEWNKRKLEFPFLPQPLRRLNARILSFILRKPFGKRHRHEETITYKLVDTVHFNHLID